MKSRVKDKSVPGKGPRPSRDPRALQEVRNLLTVHVPSWQHSAGR